MIKTTGTTICGLIYEGGVILGADTRASYKDDMGMAIIDSNCSKISRLSKNIYCCGAGSAADMMRLSGLVEAYFQAQFNPDANIPVICPVTLIKRTLYQYHGYLMCAFIIGGVDASGGNQLFSVYSHGCSYTHKFCAFGSGLNPSIGILEAGWKENLTEQEGLDLITDAITAGILYDLGSGSNVDVTIIRNNGEVSNYKPYKVVGQKFTKSIQNSVLVGSTKVLSTQVIPIENRRSRSLKRGHSADKGNQDAPKPKSLKM